MSNSLQLTPHEQVRVRRHETSALEVEVTWQPGGSKPPGHFHPHQAERFEVLAGTLAARVDGLEQRLAPGDTLDIPAGAVHQLWNTGHEPARAIWETVPAGRTLAWFEALDGLGPRPTPVSFAPLLREYRDVFRLAQRPRSVVGLVLAVVATVALALPAAAHADSIAYVKDHNVWVAAPDGSRQHQVTRDGTTEWGYASPSQADDGTILAARGTDIVALAQNGRELGRFDPPDSRDSAGQVIGGHPVDVAVSPDGKQVAWTYYHANCPPGADCMTRYVTETSAGGKTFLNHPSWVADDRLLAFGGWGSQVNLAGAAGNHDSRDHWFDDRDLFGVEEAQDLTDGELSRDGSRFVAVRSYGANTHLMFFKAGGLETAPAYACNTGNEETLDSPTWSPDGRAIAFAHEEGVEVLSLPSVEPDCPGAQSGTVVLSGASEPDWGPADVNPGKKVKPRRCRDLPTRRARKRCRQGKRGFMATTAAKPQTARFVAYVEGKQVTDWKVPRYASGSDCQGQRYTEGGGGETIRFATKPFKLLAYRLPGRTEPMLRFGTWDQFAQTDAFSVKATGTLKRTGKLEYSLDPGQCHDADDPTSSDSGPYDCGRAPFTGYTSFSWRGKRMTVHFTGSPKNDDGSTFTFDNCPIEGPLEPLEGTWNEIDQEFAPRDLLDASLGLHEVLGRKQWTDKIHRDHGTATTTTTFKLRLRRKGS